MARTAALRTNNQRAESDDEHVAESRLVAQLDNLQRISQQQRKDQLGDGWFKQIREVYNLYPSDVENPAFRRTVRIPEAQMLGFMEAIDLTDIDPRIYLIKSWENYAQDANTEVCLQAFWRDANVNLQILYALMWAWFCGSGFVQVGFDPTKRQGLGDLVVKWRDPESVFPDPYAIDDEDWQYLVFEDYMWLDRVKELWPNPAQRITISRSPEPADLSAAGKHSAFGMEVPKGPMQGMIPGLPVTNTPGDARVRVRTLFLRDATRVKIGGKDESLQLSGLAKEQFKMRYPRGRTVIECAGVILFDGENPFLHGQFPLVRFLGMPALHGFWAPPPIRYTQTLQDMAERFVTQEFENAVRMLNGIWIIDEGSGIDPERFGGVPGEVQVKAMGSASPELIQPKGSTGGSQLAEAMLQKQRQIQGFSDARMGRAPQGNVSNDLFLGSIAQGHTLTRGRGRLMYAPLRRIAYLIFSTLAQRTQDARIFADPRADGYGVVKWVPIAPDDVEKYITHVDPASIQPFSGVMIRQLALALKNMGAMDVEGLLEAVRWPDRKKVLERLNKEAAMAAQMKMAEKQAGKGKKS